MCGLIFEMACLINLQNVRLVYKTFATLYFVFIFDKSENELAMMDLMQGILSICIYGWTCFFNL